MWGNRRRRSAAVISTWSGKRSHPRWQSAQVQIQCGLSLSLSSDPTAPENSMVPDGAWCPAERARERSGSARLGWARLGSARELRRVPLPAGLFLRVRDAAGWQRRAAAPPLLMSELWHLKEHGGSRRPAPHSGVRVTTKDYLGSDLFILRGSEYER